MCVLQNRVQFEEPASADDFSVEVGCEARHLTFGASEDVGGFTGGYPFVWLRLSRIAVRFMSRVGHAYFEVEAVEQLLYGCGHMLAGELAAPYLSCRAVVGGFEVGAGEVHGAAGISGPTWWIE